VTYKVTAQDNTTKDYVVTVTVGDKPEPTPPATKVGWDHSTGIWKYIKADGSPQTGWFYDGTTYKSWFYFSANGNMVSGKWLQDGGKWYYLTGNGKMAIGTYTINGKTQSFAGNGVWKG
jgi:alpha-L-fucosidase